MKTRAWGLGLGVAGLLVGTLAAPAAAQTNPSWLEVQPASAAEHAIVSHYDIGFWLAGATAPVQVVSVPQTAWSAQPGAWWRTAMPRPVFGAFTARAKACAPAAGSGTSCSDWSVATDPFTLSPKPPATARTVP